MGVGVATCSDQPIAAVKTGASPSGAGFAKFALVPHFSKSATQIAASLRAAGQDVDNVHVLLRDLADTTKIVVDRVVTFAPGTDTVTLEDSVKYAGELPKFDAGISYRNGTTTLFNGHIVVQAYKPGAAPPPPPVIPIDYVGPGAQASRLVIAPKTAGILAVGGSQNFNVTAFDQSGTQIETPPVTFAISDPTVASISGNVVTGRGRRGTVSVVASFKAKDNGPTITDAASLSLFLPAASISLVSGGGQSGKAGAALANQAVVQVSASDGIGVPGVSVVFSAPAGGSVTPTTAVTDANGRASASLRLGNAAGPQGFAASTGAFSVAIGATATAADPSALVIASGNAQTDTIKKTLAPLSVKVTDAFGNPVSGVSVSWSRTAGSGALGAATSTSNTDGIATNTYTLGSTAGPEGVSASITGASVSFAFTTTAGGPATIAIVSGSGQTGRVKEPLASPFVVQVKDAGGNPVSSATVTWAATNGTIAATSTTDANGNASAVMTAGTTLGTASATAKIANGQSATFTATVNVGIVAQLAFITNAANGTANATLPAVTIALRDAGGNATVASNPVSIALGTNPNGAVLSGTLTRNAVNGVVTFDDLKIDRTGTGYTLVATSSTLSLTSAAFNTTTGSAAGLSIFAGNGQSATVGTAVTTAPAVKIVDAANNPIPGVSVTFTASGNGVVSPAGGVVTTDALGIAKLTSWTLGTTAGSQTLTVSSAGLTSVVIGATANAGNAFRLLMTNKGSIQTSVTAGAALTPQPALQLVDQFNNPVPAGQMNVTATIVGTGVTLGGTTTVPVGATTGSAAFANVSVNGSGSVRIAFVEGSGLIKGDTTNVITVVGGATQLLLIPATTSTLAAQAGAAITSPQLKVADAAGNPVAGVTVHFVIEKATGTSTFSSIGSADYTSDPSGLVTFSGRVPTIVGTYRVTATSPSIAGASVALTLNITPGAATHLGFQAPVSNPRVSARAGETIPVTVALLDQFENVATNSAATPITVELISPSGVTDAELRGTKTVNTSVLSGSAGQAVFLDLNINRAAIGYTLKATAATFTAVTSPALDITSSSAVKLRFSTQPSAVTAGVTMSSPVAVQILDSLNNVVAGATNLVTLTTNPTTTLANASMAAVNGLATFSSFTVGTSGTYTLAASATLGSASATATSNPFNVTAATFGPATHLAFSEQPSTTIAGATMSPAVKVEIRDANERVVTSATDPVTLSFSSPVDVAIANRGPINAVAGVATFSNLSINTAGTYSFKATTTTSGISSATSSNFTISPSTASSLSVSTHGGHGGPNAIADDELFSTGGPGPKVQLIDAYGNAVPQQDISVTASVSYQGSSIQGANPPGPASFNFTSFLLPRISITPGTRPTNSSGVADFSSAKLNGSIGDLVITFSAVLNGQTRSVTTPVHLNHGKASKASCTATLPSVVGLSHKLTVSPTLLVLDADSNVVNNTDVELVPSTGGSLAATTVTTDSSGVVRGSAWKVGSAAGTHTVGVRNATGTSCTVRAAAPHHVKLSRSSVATLKNGDAIPSIDATVVDANENAIEDTTYTVAVIGRSHSNKPISISGNAGSNSHGKSTFSSLIVDAQAQTAATLDFTVDGDASITGGSVALDVEVGTAAVLNIQGAAAFNIPIAGTLRTNKPTVSVKDHNGRNDVANVEIAWSLSGCTGVSLASATSFTGNNGQASAPDISATQLFGSSCQLVASRTGATSVTFTLSP